MEHITLNYTLGGDETTPDQHLIFRIYNNGVLYHTTGSSTTDDDVTINTGVATIENVEVENGTSYSLTIAEVDQAGNEGNQSNAVVIHISPVANDGLYPTLSNFRVENAYPNRVYFDSSENITGSNYIGFKITGKTINSVYCAPSSTTGHYFTVSNAFNFWDNNTIRYSGGSDFEDSESNGLHSFDLQYITNNINEPSASTDRYVTVTGAGSHNGTLGNEWTLAEACANATSGMTVHVEKGDYGSGNFVVSNNGTSTSPIKFVGYNSIPGDDPSLTRTQTTVLDDSVMPYFNGSNSGTGFSTNGKDYIIVRNMIAENYFDACFSFGDGCQGVMFDNVYARGSQKTTGYGVHGQFTDLLECRVINSYMSNCNGHGIRMAGERTLMDDLYVSSYGMVHMDYYISLYGSTIGDCESIIRNCEVVRDAASETNPGGHAGHGISLRGNGIPVENSLVEDCTIDYVGSAIELRTDRVQYCVVRNVVVNNHKETAGWTYQAVRITGAQNNIIDRVTNIDSEFFVQFLGSLETSQVDAVDAGNNNTFKNCLSYNTGVYDPAYFIYVREDQHATKDRVPNNNTFINCTIENYDNLTYYEEAPSPGVGNKFVNCIVTEITSKNLNDAGTWDFEYCDLYDCGSWANSYINSDGNINVNPNFTGSYIPQNTSLKAGTITSVKYDYDETERDTTNPTMGAKEI